MITASDSFTTIELKDYYAILPSDGRIQKLYQTNGIKFEPVPTDSPIILAPIHDF